MKKKLSCYVLGITLIFLLLSCSATAATENAETTAPENTDIGITFSFLGYVFWENGIDVYGQLYVDNFTNIVYLRSQTGRYNSGVTPYLAPNGQPYTYDRQTGSLVPLPSYQGEIFPKDWIITVDRSS